ncbi:dual specificity tyrosine-phosphorylation-regulated kinase 2-like isoform X2 [Manis pentadactyla]|uniref:dual specificity tyrosine-phosphorylation-regulated kinase 2-like isoform X2 n=1 Tax=Manis pentadactyla TaxID=143292 RepID=UPI00255C3C8D|nr:dual specificity tyrosine-phosphorylation-regulated kinase 2-like isoform X2 [Manis pentadactyla]
MLTRKPSAAAPAAYPTGQGGDSAIHQLQSSPGARRGAPRTGVGTGPPSPIALPPLRASNAAAAAHTVRETDIQNSCIIDSGLLVWKYQRQGLNTYIPVEYQCCKDSN